MPQSTNAVTYEEVTQAEMQYNINNFYLSGDNIIINGWSTTERHQHLTGNDTHEYSLVLTNKNTNESMVYIAELKKADKTRLMRATEWKTAYTSKNIF